jgi:hypothetical protein
MLRGELKVSELQWRKARRSVGNGACVEVTPASGHVLVRDSQNQDGPVVPYAGIIWRAFLAGAKAGQFDPDRR